jgi:hypothetical protein
VHDPRLEATGRHQVEGPGCLAHARLDEQVTAGGQPGSSGGRDATMHIEAVGSAVECDSSLVIAGFGRHLRDLVRGHVRRIDDEHVDAPPQVTGKRIVEIALHDTRTEVFEVAPGRSHGGGVDVGGDELDRLRRPRDRRADRAGTAAEIDDDRCVIVPGTIAGEADRSGGERLGTAARNEDARLERDAHARESGPSEHLLERFAGDPPGDQTLECGRDIRCIFDTPVGSGLHEQGRLLLGEDATRSAQAGDELRRWAFGHHRIVSVGAGQHRWCRIIPHSTRFGKALRTSVTRGHAGADPDRGGGFPVETSTVIWIIVAVIVVIAIVVIAVLMTRRRRNEEHLESERRKAAELRQNAYESDVARREREASAASTAAAAQQAQASAKQAEADAMQAKLESERLAREAAEHQSSAQEMRDEAAERLRKANEVDPDVSADGTDRDAVRDDRDMVADRDRDAMRDDRDMVADRDRDGIRDDRETMRDTDRRTDPTTDRDADTGRRV